jgi:L-cysteine desulfidase
MSQDFAGRLHWIGQSDIAFYLARLEAENARLLSENVRLNGEVSALKMRVTYSSNSVKHLEEVCKDLLLEKESTTRMLRTNFSSAPVADLAMAARGANN